MLVVATLGIVLALSTAASADPSVEDVFERLVAANEGSRGFTGRFEQQKHVSLLADPVRTSGRIRYESPGEITWDVEEPADRTVVVTEGDVFVDGERVSSPWGLGTGVRALAAALEGDRQALERVFRISVDGTDERIDVTLLPKGLGKTRLRRLRVRFALPDLLPSRLDVVDTENDWLEIRLFDVERIREPPPQATGR